MFAIFSYVGFESAATLGREARNPHSAIPKAIKLTGVVAGLFFVFATYVITQGFKDDAAKLGASGAPLGDILTGQSPLLTALVYFGAAISSFACALASLNAFSRMMFSLGRYNVLHASLGRVHATHHTPHVALTFGAVVNFVLVCAFSGQAELDTLGWYGTIAAFGFIVVYLLCSVAAPVYLRRTGEATRGDVFIGALGAVAMALALVDPGDSPAASCFGCMDSGAWKRMPTCFTWPANSGNPLRQMPSVWCRANSSMPAGGFRAFRGVA